MHVSIAQYFVPQTLALTVSRILESHLATLGTTFTQPHVRSSFFKEATGLFTLLRILFCFIKNFLMTVSKSITLELLWQCLIQYSSLPKSISKSLLTHCNLSKSFYSLSLFNNLSAEATVVGVINSIHIH